MQNAQIAGIIGLTRLPPHPLPRLDLVPQTSTEAIPRIWPLAGLALVGLLFFIWPIPHSTTVRDLLLVAVLGVGIYLVRHARQPITFPDALRLPVVLIGLLTLWMLAVAVFISTETAWTLSEIKGQWLRALLALAAGALAATAFAHDATGERRLVGVVCLALLFHVVAVDFTSIWIFLTEVLLNPDIEQKHLPTRIAGLTGGSDKSNYLSNMMLYLLLAETFTRLAYRRTFLPVGNRVLALLLAITLFSIFVEAMRNGVIEVTLILLLLTAVFIHVTRERVNKRLLIAGVLSLLVLLVGLGYFNYRITPGWKTLVETVPIALDTDTHKAWLSWNSGRHPLPRLEDGSEVGWSNYMRIARFKVGLELTREQPLGIGFGRNAFAHAVKIKYNEHQSSHSHSGLIDLAIGVGFPGTLLWIGFLFSLLRLAWGRTIGYRSYPALLLLLIVSGFGIRMIVDSIIRDHMLQQFFFLVGLFAVLSTRPPSPHSRDDRAVRHATA